MTGARQESDGSCGRGTVSWGILLGAVAVRLATFTETRGQKTGTQILDVGHAGGELIAFIPQCFQGSGHGGVPPV